VREADVGPADRVVRRAEAGAGGAAVVLEAGMNNGVASWPRVIPLLAPHVRVAAYDRAPHAAAGARKASTSDV
jgi:hypothetical protein